MIAEICSLGVALATAILGQARSRAINLAFARRRARFGPPSFATIHRRGAPLPSSPGDIPKAKCSVREVIGAEPMKAKVLVESVKKLLVERYELITNCLAVLALLAVGVVWA